MAKKGKLKIAIFHLAFFYSGGGEKLVLEELKELTRRGHDVTCFTPTIDRELCYPDIIGKYKIRTIFPSFRKLFRKHESVEIFATCLLFPFIARKFKNFDVTFGANQPGPWLCWLVKKLTGIPYVIYLAQPTRILYPRKIDKECEIWVRKKSYFLPLVSIFGKWAIRWADRISIRGANRMLVNGTYMASVLERIYSKKGLSCPAGAKTTLRVKNRFEGKKAPYILVTNRHFPQKKFEYVIRAMPKIIRAVGDVKLVITGNFTDYTKKLMGLVGKLNLKRSVVFTNYVSEVVLKTLYTNAAVYIYTAPDEDFGMGVIEAMAMGVPVVAWNKAGPATTVLDGETGFLVKPYDESEFTKKIILLLRNKTINGLFGRNARQHAQKNFSWEAHHDLLEKALLETAKNGL